MNQGEIGLKRDTVKCLQRKPSEPLKGVSQTNIQSQHEQQCSDTRFQLEQTKQKLHYGK
eukprot:m.95274 g.95274  ORF g.95274 m.95274 type:complete len:59 (-) comp26805_c0_seq1:533-709(-)